MSEEKKVPLVLTTEEVAAALRCCATNANTGGGCRNCPMNAHRRQVECDELICLMAADRIGELLEENRKLRSATENLCQREQTEMIRLAREMGTALDRGLTGVNEELFRKLLGSQQLLTELGRESAIRVEPAGEKGWRVLSIEVGDAVIFGGEAGGPGS